MGSTSNLPSVLQEVETKLQAVLEKRDLEAGRALVNELAKTPLLKIALRGLSREGASI